MLECLGTFMLKLLYSINPGSQYGYGYLATPDLFKPDNCSYGQAFFGEFYYLQGKALLVILDSKLDPNDFRQPSTSIWPGPRCSGYILSFQ